MSNWDHIIQKAEAINLSGKDLLKIVDGKANIHRYSDLDNINSIDQLLGEHKASFILYQHASGFGHWVTLMKIDSETLEFYDPYGIVMDQELKFSEFNLSIHNGVPTPHLTKLVEKSGLKLIQSTQVNQQTLRKVNTCGRHASLRIKLRDIPLKDYNQLLRKNASGNADFVVTYLTYLMTN